MLSRMHLQLPGSDGSSFFKVFSWSMSQFFQLMYHHYMNVKLQVVISSLGLIVWGLRLKGDRGEGWQNGISLLVVPYIAIHCPALPYIAIHCYTSSYIATHCHTLPYIDLHWLTLPCIAIHCFISPYIALHSHTLPYIVIPCHTLSYIAIHCHTLS